MKRAWYLRLAAACGDDSSVSVDEGPDTPADGSSLFQTHDAIRVEADDGSATLAIAPNSIPEGTDPVDIRVTSSTSSLVADDGPAPIAYELEPDGLRFREPAQLTVRHEWDVTPFAVLLSDDGSVELPTVNVADPDAENLSEVDVAIAHFSEISLPQIRVPRINATASRLRATWLDGITEGQVSSTMPDLASQRYIVVGDPGFLVEAVEQADAREGFFERLAAINIAPLGPSSTRPSSLPITWEPVFRCTDAAQMDALIQLKYRTVLSLNATVMRDGVSETVEATQDVLGRSSTHLVGPCLGPELSRIDTSDDCTDSEGPDATCSFFAEFVNIAEGRVQRTDIDAAQVNAAFGNTSYPCDEFGGGLRTVCTATPGVFPEGAMWVGTMVLGEDVPEADPDHSLIYSLVFDSDGEGDNDWVPVDPFVWDYFQGTDRWYQLSWDHQAMRWSVRATQVDASQRQEDVPSAVRVVIVQDTVTFFVPITELPSAVPSYRFSAFAHDGRFSRSDRGGDVLGVDPTAPLEQAIR
ncbi:MAG: hypothetical protein AAF645_08095 [Myxococcota bacterium]